MPYPARRFLVPCDRILQSQRFLGISLKIGHCDSVAHGSAIHCFVICKNYIVFLRLILQVLCSILWFNSSKGSMNKGGAVVRALTSHQCSPGSNPSINAICCMWVECVAGSLRCSKRFFSRYFGFPLSSYKTNISKIQFKQEW